MTEKKTDAWMPLWIGAYLADTQHLTRDEHGAYFLLMMAYWRNKGPLPDDDKRLAAIVKASPKEWKALRETLAEFFTVANGTWKQKRIDAELAGANDRSAKATSKAQAAAKARWGNAPSIPQALPEDMQDECPTSHTNTLGSNKPTFVAKDEDGFLARSAQSGLTPGDVCKAMKAHGIQSVNPSNPKLLHLIIQGISLAEFEQAAIDSVAIAKGFIYALAMAEGRRNDALQPPRPAKAPAKQAETFAERDARIGRERWEQMTGRTHPDNLKTTATHGGMVVDISPVKLEFQA